MRRLYFATLEVRFILSLTFQKLSLAFNPTLYGGGHSVPPPKVLVSGAFQSDLRDPRCWHNSYMIMRIGFMKKKFQFFQFFGHPSHTKRFFCTFGPKITYSYILGGQYVHLTPKKCFLEAFSKKCPWNAPPPGSTLTSRSPDKVGLKCSDFLLMWGGGGVWFNPPL